MKKLGLIVNPIAGMGGRVGLKGTDGKETVGMASRLGANPISPIRAVRALEIIARNKNHIRLITYPCDMGEDESRECDFDPVVIGSIIRGHTSAADTRSAAEKMLGLGVDLIVFSGGDGTARDICEVIRQEVPAVGIPAGVKIHSGAFAKNPRKAGELAVEYLQGNASVLEAEVMDIDENAFRQGIVSAKLFGYLLVPYDRNLVQPSKSASLDVLDEKESQRAIACSIVDNMSDEYYYILGPGTTVKAIAEELGIEKTLLGVDVVKNRRIAAMDANEQELLKLIDAEKAKIIVSPIGRQGYIFGRGNQQISPEVIRRIGRENILIIATKNKISSIGFDQPLLVDTGDERVDEMLAGYVRVTTGYSDEAVMKIAA